MGYKDENIKHRQGITDKPKYQCPECKKPLSIPKKTFMVICGSCKKTVLGENIIENK